MLTALEISNRYCSAMNYENYSQIYTDSIILEITVHFKVGKRCNSTLHIH